MSPYRSLKRTLIDPLKEPYQQDWGLANSEGEEEEVVPAAASFSHVEGATTSIMAEPARLSC